jgi:hypothetical protein
MRKLLLIAFVLSLTGCAAVDAMLMTKYDPNEYLLITEIKVDAKHYAEACNNPIMTQPNAIAMANKTELFEVYSENLPHNGDGVKAATALNEIAQGLVKQYNDQGKVSPLFCKLKFEGISHSADTIQHVLGNRPR